MAGEVIVDALPYIDQGYEEPGVRENALAMVDEETRRYRPTKNYLEHLQQLNLGAFETDIMKAEFERMQQRQPMDLLSMKRYELPPPPAGKMTDIAAWNECVENSMAQLEHQATRICNLELMLDYGCEAWKSYLETLIQLVLQAQKQLQSVRKQIQETNWQRKNEQLHAGERLRQLEATWVGLVSKNYEIEQACAMLEKDAMRTKAQLALQPARREPTREPSPEPSSESSPEPSPEPMQVDEPVVSSPTKPQATVPPPIVAAPPPVQVTVPPPVVAVSPPVQVAVPPPVVAVPPPVQVTVATPVQAAVAPPVQAAVPPTVQAPTPQPYVKYAVVEDKDDSSTDDDDDSDTDEVIDEDSAEDEGPPGML